MNYGKALIVLTILFFIAGCSKQYEVNIKEQTSLWKQEFVASRMPFSGSSLELEVSGKIDGIARISAYPSNRHHESMKTMLVGPGEFVFSVTELEYWNKFALLEFDPDVGAVGSFRVKVKFD